MARYAADMHRTASATLAIGSVTADATRPRRGKLGFLSFGCEGTPADGIYLLQVQRCTAAGTSTAVTPFPLDPADAATEADFGENHTVDPTLTAGAILLSVPVNQRSTFTWYAPPGGELVYPATAANGFAIETPTAALLAVSATIHVEEM